jgi:N-acetyl-gamma-glutamyl-phosphate reductase
MTAPVKLKGPHPTIFIDGEAGTTGLGIRDRLARLPLVEVRSIDPARRKDAQARKDMMAAVDLVVLCLPDDAAREAVAFADELGAQAPKIVDASTAHRVAPGWVYGFPELNDAQQEAVAQASRVANPGCYPTGAVALIRPLVDAGLVPADFPLSINAVSGYSGGGKSMIEAYESGKAPPFELYGLGLEHKHVPELQKYAGLTTRPIFVPSVGAFRQGMLVSVPLHLDALPGKPKVADLHRVLSLRYVESDWITAPGLDTVARLGGKIEPQAVNDTNRMSLYVFGAEARRQAVLVARLDNLGKGASGAAVQNIKLMLRVRDRDDD